MRVEYVKKVSRSARARYKMDIYLESESEKKVIIFKHIKKVRVEYDQKVSRSARICNKMDIYLESQSKEKIMIFKYI